ncbi:MAG: formate/nitrite transporter family protein [Epsilonproteobacteria bacterium]|nr:MAG: formate/nitrite transporter family protein [Campylobacterota bacterium]RLA65780.1 MAG: formate/nitrite transporter family protein [Campylobacterota bacterium]
MKDDKEKLIGPDGQEITIEEEAVETERSKEREIEDITYTPVIIKRIDETIRHPDDTLARVIEEGLEEIRRPFLSLFLSALAAGLILGFAAMSVALASQLVPPDTILNRFVTAFVYPLGFIICIMSGTNLFTEHTATAVYPILDKKEPIKKLFRIWIIIIIGNLLGTFLSACLITLADPVINAKLGYIQVASHLINYPWESIFISAVLAGWLMAQGGWLIQALPSSSGQIMTIYIVTFIIGIGGLHHSIAGSAEVFTAALLSDINIEHIFKFLGAAIFGNLIGGSFFVAILNYGHIKKTRSVD